MPVGANRRRVSIAAASAGLALAVAWLIAGRLREASPGKAIVSGRPTLLKQTPLDCRVVEFDNAERVARLSGWSWFENWPKPFVAWACRNPLLGGHYYGEVLIENTSGKQLGIYPSGVEVFWITTQIQDADGRPAYFDNPCLHSNLRFVPFGRVDPGAPVVTLERGHVVSLPLDICGYMNEDAPLKPGRHTVRVVCSYFQAPDGEDCNVLSAPFSVTLTADDIRFWRAIRFGSTRPGFAGWVRRNGLFP